MYSCILNKSSIIHICLPLLTGGEGVTLSPLWNTWSTSPSSRMITSLLLPWIPRCSAGGWCITRSMPFIVSVTDGDSDIASDVDDVCSSHVRRLLMSLSASVSLYSDSLGMSRVGGDIGEPRFHPRCFDVFHLGVLSKMPTNLFQWQYSWMGRGRTSELVNQPVHCSGRGVTGCADAVAGVTIGIMMMTAHWSLVTPCPLLNPCKSASSTKIHPLITSMTTSSCSSYSLKPYLINSDGSKSAISSLSVWKGVSATL